MVHNAVLVEEVKRENKNAITLTLEGTLGALPGQFVMLWLPGIGEKPMSLGNNSPPQLTICAVGPFTKKAVELKKGSTVWYRGPYGNGFRLEGEKILLVGGGSGITPLRFLSRQAQRKGMDVTFIMGAKSKEMLLQKPMCRSVVATEDGSEGMKGFATDALESILKEEDFSHIYSCGPELMMKKVLDISNKKNIPCQLSLERFMMCGTGLCGSCAMGQYLVCKDGPVFTGKQLSEVGEFGNSKRDSQGRKVEI